MNEIFLLGTYRLFLVREWLRPLPVEVGVHQGDTGPDQGARFTKLDVLTTVEFFFAIGDVFAAMLKQQKEAIDVFFTQGKV